MSITSLPVEDFTAALSSAEPTPGGGAVAALAGALGVSLGAMCANCTFGRGESAELRTLLSEAEALRAAFLQLAERDSEAYRAYRALRALPKEEPKRPVALEEGLFALTQPPLETMHLGCRAVELLEKLAPCSSAALRADIAAAASLCRSALACAAVTLRANTTAMKNRETAAALEREAEKCFAEYDRRAEALFRAVYDGER